MSDQQSERRAMNEYNHRLSMSGYAVIVEDLVQSSPLANDKTVALNEGNKNKGSRLFSVVPLDNNIMTCNNGQNYPLVNETFFQRQIWNANKGSRPFHNLPLENNKRTFNNAKEAGKAANNKPSKPQSQNGKKNCWLALESKENIVAKGFVFAKVGVDEKIHTVALGDSNVRVSISVALDGGALLPVLVGDEYITVESAVGVPVAWPKELVITEIQDMEENNAREGYGKNVSNVYADKRKNNDGPIGHWVLVMIDLKAKELYYFDSLRVDKQLPNLAIMLKCAFVQYAADSRIRTFDMDWKIVKCPIQDGGFEFGYYVLKFMKHFMEDPTTSIKIKTRELATKTRYTTAELADIRLDLVNYMIPYLAG